MLFVYSIRVYCIGLFKFIIIPADVYVYVVILFRTVYSARAWQYLRCALTRIIWNCGWGIFSFGQCLTNKLMKTLSFTREGLRQEDEHPFVSIWTQTWQTC